MKNINKVRIWMVCAKRKGERRIGMVLDGNGHHRRRCKDGKRRSFWPCLSIKGVLDLHEARIPVEIWGIDHKNMLRRHNLPFAKLKRME